jgi:hypothetical protein
MGKRGPKVKEIQEFSVEVWDNYSPYHKLAEPSQKELDQRFEKKAIERMHKNLGIIANSAGYETTSSILTILTKKALFLYN